jgi:hypothetical protein
MTPTWLEEFCNDEKVTLKRVEVVWEGKHVVLVKKLRPVRWHVIDKKYDWFNSPARNEGSAGKGILQGEQAVGRLSRPDFERLLERVQQLDAKYPKLAAAKKAAEKAREERTAAEHRRARQRASKARVRARKLRSLLKEAGFEYSTHSRPVMRQTFELDEVSVELDGIRVDINSTLTGLTLFYVAFDLRDGGLTPEEMFALVKKLAAIKLPKGIRR